MDDIYVQKSSLKGDLSEKKGVSGEIRTSGSLSGGLTKVYSLSGGGMAKRGPRGDVCELKAVGNKLYWKYSEEDDTAWRFLIDIPEELEWQEL